MGGDLWEGIECVCVRVCGETAGAGDTEGPGVTVRWVRREVTMGCGDKWQVGGGDGKEGA